jgi:hypothetical protein
VPIQGNTYVLLVEAIHYDISFTLIPRSNISEVFCNLEPVFVRKRTPSGHMATMSILDLNGKRSWVAFACDYVLANTRAKCNRLIYNDT